MKLVRALLVVLLALAVLGGLPTTTSASDATSAHYVYDSLTIARVDVHPIDGAEARPTRPSGVRRASASPSQLAGGASTTPYRSFIATEAAAGSSIDDILRPGGNLLGQAGSSSSIRELSGGLSEAQATFNQLTQGGTVVSNSTYPGTLVRLADVGTVGIRTVMSNSPNTAVTIDVNIPGFDITKIKFNP